MKELQWDDSIDDSNEFFDAAVVLPVDEENMTDETPVNAVSTKTQYTELRRRIEERLDGKRIDHEFEYDDLDGLLDNMG
ncbi:MAG: hypothetical protein ACI80L_001598 [Pseudohongiellaceae bacterium]|jgi:hypothetical protein|nr:hypothetical protein [Pseudomonadota bacterium]MDA1289938.1 hypothetical protein [Pseudomonadota bacterium]